jgi:hypothetical protein
MFLQSCDLLWNLVSYVRIMLAHFARKGAQTLSGALAGGAGLVFLASRLTVVG